MKTLAIEGELTIFTATELKASLLAFLNTDDELELNLANVTEIDTAGLQLLILIKREAPARGKALRFVLHSKAVLDVLELTRLTRTFGDQLVLAYEESSR